MDIKGNISQNLKIIRSRIDEAVRYSGRDPKSVRLLLATKTVTPENILFALEQGENLIGENKVQELKQKCDEVAALKPEVHFIGHLQSNKIKEVLKWVTCIESLDRLELAIKLDKRLAFEGKKIDVYIQVNTSNEESKFGVDPLNAVELVQEISKLENIKIKGLMTIGKLGASPEETRMCFKVLKRIKDQVIQLEIPNVEIQELSMGMSGDFEIAIAEGATIIRVGTAIFGDRIHPDSYYWNENN